jgi:hypothetical protein
MYINKERLSVAVDQSRVECSHMPCCCCHQADGNGNAAEAEETAEPATAYAPKKQMRSEDPEFQHQQKERWVLPAAHHCTVSAPLVRKCETGRDGHFNSSTDGVQAAAKVAAERAAAAFE